MERHLGQYPVIVGTRLSLEDREKLRRLCDACQRPPGELLRLLVRLAEPTHLPPLTFAQGHDEARRASK